MKTQNIPEITAHMIRAARHAYDKALPPEANRMKEAIKAALVALPQTNCQRRGEPVGFISGEFEQVNNGPGVYYLMGTILIDDIKAIPPAPGARLYTAPQPAEPRTEFDDPRVQQVYEIICGDNHPPAGEHWDGYVSRLIVDALFSGEPVGEIRPDDQSDDEVWAEIWADLPPGTKLYAEPVQKAQKECSKDAERSDPVKEPSSGDIQDSKTAILAAAIQWANIRADYRTTEELEKANRDFTLRIEAELGIVQENAAEDAQPSEPEGWQLVPNEPTEEMLIDAMEASLLGRPSPDDDSYVRSIVAAWCAAAPKFGEEP